MYKGCHATLDIINFFLPARDGGEKILKILKESLKFSSCHAVHEKLVVLGETSPPGFTSVILIDESHLTAHCYSEEGLLAIDAFTCGKSEPEKMIDFIYNLYVILTSHTSSHAQYHLPNSVRLWV